MLVIFSYILSWSWYQSLGISLWSHNFLHHVISFRVAHIKFHTSSMLPYTGYTVPSIKDIHYEWFYLLPHSKAHSKTELILIEPRLNKRSTKYKPSLQHTHLSLCHIEGHWVASHVWRSGGRDCFSPECFSSSVSQHLHRTAVLPDITARDPPL